MNTQGQGKVLKTRKRVDIMKKYTYTDALSFAMDMIATAMQDTTDRTDSVYTEMSQCFDKLDALRTQMEKRATVDRKPTKKQAEGEGLKVQMLDFLKGKDKARCGEIAEAVGLTGQRCSALLSQLVKTQEVVKTTEKRVTYFSLPSDEDAVQALPGELGV
jgi:hypothetical protein